ncbi:MAG: helix-turn-helix transcriptional regulator [Faecalicoccus sp.]|nr:helix-turn-helix transcriptional regulator [Faecalicoccus sp.]
MNNLSSKIALKRKSLGMTQIEFANQLSVTRQTVSRWEAGTVLPDIDKIPDIASILNVSCDYLLKDEIDQDTPLSSVSRLLFDTKGKTVRFVFFDGEADMDLFNKDCRILEFEGNWIKVEVQTNKGRLEKLISLSSILSFEIIKEEQ